MKKTHTPPQSSALVLASGSKTRADMLRNAGLNPKIIPATVDEGTIKDSMLKEEAKPRDVVDALAELKARSVSTGIPGAFVIGADQILVLDGEIFSKAEGQEEAAATLKRLSGKTHTLMTAVVVCKDGIPVWRCFDQAEMTVRPLSNKFIQTYLESAGDDILASVGCYQLEGFGAQLFEKIDGDFFTILGMPLLPLLDLLRRYNFIKV